MEKLLIVAFTAWLVATFCIAISTIIYLLK